MPFMRHACDLAVPQGHPMSDLKLLPARGEPKAVPVESGRRRTLAVSGRYPLISQYRLRSLPRA